MNNLKRWVTISNFETFIKLGVYPKEQTKPQRVIISVSLEVESNIHNDNIEKIYRFLYSYMSACFFDSLFLGGFCGRIRSKKR